MSAPSPVWPLLAPLEPSAADARCAVSARGVRVRFADGAEKLCATSGMWNANLGYGNTAVARATGRALREASYLTVWGFDNAYARRAGDALIELAGRSAYARVLFSTSGGAANDAAMKLARHYQVLRGRDEARILLGLKGGYHGLTFGSFALSDVSLGGPVYGVDRRSIGHLPPNDCDALVRVMDELGERVAGVFVEPVIGNGAVPLNPDFVEALIALRARYGFLLIADEIATGFGRAGPGLFASADWAAGPDVLLTAKAMTNGTQAASALLIAGHVADVFAGREAVLAHAETQAGTPPACAAILATISEFARLDIPARSARLGDRLGRRLDALAQRSVLVSGVSGQGCMRALNLRRTNGEALDPAAVDRVVGAIFAAGAIVHPGPSSILIMPALVYTSDDLDELDGRLTEGLSRVVAQAVA